MVDDAQDVFQEACVTILKKADEFRSDDDSEFIRWACKIAHYKRLSFRRDQQVDRLRFQDALIDSIAEKQREVDHQHAERNDALRHCLGQLRPVDRELFEQRYRDKITSKQLAAELGRPANTVYKALRRTRGQLLECIERTLEQEDRD